VWAIPAQYFFFSLDPGYRYDAAAQQKSQKEKEKAERNVLRKNPFPFPSRRSPRNITADVTTSRSLSSLHLSLR